jgi:hypothetical protein
LPPSLLVEQLLAVDPRQVALQQVALQEAALQRVALQRVALQRVALQRVALRRVALRRVALRRVALRRVALRRVALRRVAHHLILVRATHAAPTATAMPLEAHTVVFVPKAGKAVPVRPRKRQRLRAPMTQSHA